MLGDAARDEQPKELQVRGQVQGKTVHCDPTGDPHPDGPKLSQPSSAARTDPTIGSLFVDPEPDPIVDGSGLNAPLSCEQLHRVDERRNVPTNIPPTLYKLYDRIGDELARRVECDVAASSRLHQVNPTRRQRFSWHKHVLALSTSPQGDHRVVLDEQHDIPHAALLPLLL